MEALGLIELFGVVPAVEALDAALKAADVKRQSFTRVHGGLVTVTVTGEVAAVQAAMDAAAAAAGRVGEVLSVHVIPRPAEGIESILDEPQEPCQRPKKPKAAPKPKAELPAKAEIPKKSAAPAIGGELSMTELEAMSVVKLRAAARDMGLSTMSKREIRDAKRDELLEAIRKFREREE